MFGHDAISEHAISSLDVPANATTAATIGAFTASASAAVLVKAAVNAALPEFTSAIADAVLVKANLNAALPDFASAITGAVVSVGDAGGGGGRTRRVGWAWVDRELALSARIGEFGIAAAAEIVPLPPEEPLPALQRRAPPEINAAAELRIGPFGVSAHARAIAGAKLKSAIAPFAVRATAASIVSTRARSRIPDFTAVATAERIEFSDDELLALLLAA